MKLKLIKETDILDGEWFVVWLDTGEDKIINDKKYFRDRIKAMDYYQELKKRLEENANRLSTEILQEFELPKKEE